MTRPQKSRYPVSSFGPELLAVLIKGATERVEIPCPDMKTMQGLQMRLHMLRGAMAREKHPQYELVCKARTMRTWDKDSHPKDVKSCVLVVQPNDQQYTDILKSAGVEVLPAHKDLLEETAAPETPKDPGMEHAPLPAFDPSDPYSRFKS